MIDRKTLLIDLQKLQRTLEDDLRNRCGEVEDVDSKLRSEYEEAKSKRRTALAYEPWRDEQLTQIAAAWILGFAAATWLLARVHGKMRARGSVAGRFFAWLGEHRHQVAQGVGMFQGVRITPGTRLLRFTRVLSLGFLTFRTQTRLYVEGVEPHPDKPETF